MNIIEFFVKLINVIILTLYATGNDKKKNDHQLPSMIRRMTITVSTMTKFLPLMMIMMKMTMMTISFYLEHLFWLLIVRNCTMFNITNLQKFASLHFLRKIFVFLHIFTFLW